MLSQIRLSVRLSVCPSHGWISRKRLNVSSKFFHRRSDRPNILVFRHQRSSRNSDDFTPNGGAKCKGVAKTSNFRLICGYISERVLDRGIVTMEDEYKVVCALSNSVTFDDLEWPRTPVSRSQCSLKAYISQTVHPIHSMFGSRLGFSGSVDRMVLFVVW